MRRMYAFFLAAVFSGAAGAQAYQPDFAPATMKGPARGPANEVMVLGSPHLSYFPKTFDPATLRGLEDRLAAWKPHAISIEALPGAQCDHLRRYPGRYKDTIASYCWDPAPARRATGLDVPGATAQAEQLLASWPANPSSSQRRRLAALFLAGGERASALVQWLRLPEAERRAGDGLDDTLVTLLDQLKARRDESYLIAARLAARLGHEQVFAMDDHTADRMVADEKAWGAAIMKAWDNPAVAQRRKTDEALQANLATPDDLLALYRAYNRPEEMRLAFAGDFGAALEEPSAQRFGRQYVGYWETRNLRMAANIRDALTPRPGSRMLVVVGASHKGYLEAYLHQMHDVRVVDARGVLR
ncbi:DUF5694 domain-containing protein [Massilia sp. MS-15]|uniref:DUF5694 domain-containing protein n=1 Tax=Massilia sp. MS-15 TaxID=2878200 RepID=UPI001CD7D114|nr:DUF5694 domain-containing protein [Massilia sp. MS-15]MCA1248334.1 DUF5694 domain-containing protein [Massilia sp. MS-15]